MVFFFVTTILGAALVLLMLWVFLARQQVPFSWWILLLSGNMDQYSFFLPYLLEKKKKGAMNFEYEKFQEGGNTEKEMDFYSIFLLFCSFALLPDIHK